MKPKLLLVAFMIAGVLKIHAQDCKNYYYLMNNAEVQITIFDKNNKTTGIQNWKITNVKKTGAGFSSMAALSFTNDKGEQIAQANGVYKCEGGRLMADMRIAMPQTQAKELKDGEAKMDEAYVEYPASMSIGMQLPDAHLNMKMNASGLPSTVQYDMKNRNVTGREKVTTPAGSWDAYVIKYEAVMKIKMAGIGVPITMTITEWFVPGFGTVKTESYSKKGKLEGNTLLTKLTR